MKNIFVVGRHSGTFPAEFNVVGSENVNFSVNHQECAEQIKALAEKALGAGASLVFQATPGIVAIALAHLYCQAQNAFENDFVSPESWQNAFANNRLGVIISKPGARPTSVTKEFLFNAVEDGEVAKEAILMANPNAKILETQPVYSGVGYTPEKLTVTVDPPMRFEFDRIEWL